MCTSELKTRGSGSALRKLGRLRNWSLSRREAGAQLVKKLTLRYQVKDLRNLLLIEGLRRVVTPKRAVLWWELIVWWLCSLKLGLGDLVLPNKLIANSRWSKRSSQSWRCHLKGLTWHAASSDVSGCSLHHLRYKFSLNFVDRAILHRVWRSPVWPHALLNFPPARTDGHYPSPQ